jgi:nucleosome binding factor SPN SPT16 subunit
MDVMFDLITYPFKKGFELIKSAVSEVGTFLKDTFSGAFTFIIGALEKVWEKMKGIGSFISDTIGKTFSFVGRIVGTSEETPSKTATESKTSVKTDDLLINTIVNSNRVLAEKLDKLTSMMASGQIAVYIDGQRANQLLATSNSKFGSFGQATTN